MVQMVIAIALAWLVAQFLLKPAIASFKAGHFVPEAIFWQGGMPSGHAALVGALVAALVKTNTVYSPLVAVAVVFSGIVLYEALITRNILMRQAEILQGLTNHKLDRVVGHQPLEVVAGLMVGISISWWLVL